VATAWTLLALVGLLALLIALLFVRSRRWNVAMLAALPMILVTGSVYLDMV
jgi:hypothetical protein